MPLQYAAEPTSVQSQEILGKGSQDSSITKSVSKEKGASKDGAVDGEEHTVKTNIVKDADNLII